MGKSKLDTWLTRTADRCGIEGGQGRCGGAVLFSALAVMGGIGVLLTIGAAVAVGQIFGWWLQ